MKKIVLVLSVFIMPCFGAFAQNINMDQMKKMSKDAKMHYGIKAGYNFAKLSGSTPSFNPKTNNGFMIAGFLAPSARGGMGFRSEIIYSRQGFSFDASGKMNNVTQDYIYMPQLTTFTIAKMVQLQAGAQIGYLLNSKQGTQGSSSQEVMNYFNRIDYGAAAGIEVYPIKRLILGARYNISRGNMFKQQASMPVGIPSPFPFDPNEFKGKNAVVQFFLGVKL